MNFIWEMTEQNWKNMMHDVSLDVEGKPLSNDDYYGSMYCGDFCIEFYVYSTIRDKIGHTILEMEYFIWTNIFQLYKDTGYAETEDGIPYDLTDEYIDVKEADSFDKFKRNCEKSFERIVALRKWEQYADKGCDWNID